MTAVATRSLVAELRSATRVLHAQVEAAADIPARLDERSGYAALLADLQALHAGFEAALETVPGLERTRPPIDLAARRRSPLLAADLAALGVTPPPPRAVPDDAAPSDTAGALGCLYVLEGSARGGGVIAALAVERLGPDIPRRGLEGGDRASARARWDALLAAIDAHGERADADGRRRTVAAAEATFRAFGAGLACTAGGG